MTDYWNGEYKTNELALLRTAAERDPAHLEYINALIGHYDAGGAEKDAPDAPHTIKYVVACEIADAVEGIYRAVRGTDRSGPTDRTYLRRQLAVARRRASRRRSAARRRASEQQGPDVLSDLFDLTTSFKPEQ